MSPIPARVVARVYHAVAVTFALALAVLTLSFSTSAATPPAPPLRVGLAAVTTAKTNVRSTPDGTLVGTQPRYAVGSITVGPTFSSADSAWWVKVTFNSGPSGWVGADMLINGIPTPKSVIVGNGQNQAMVLDEFGNIEVAFASSFDSSHNPIYSFTESTNQGLTFSTPTVLPMRATFQIPAPSGPQVAAERNGAIDIVYLCAPGSCPADPGNFSVAMIRSTDHGATWSAPIQISLPPRGSDSGASSPVIAACGGGITIAWVDDGVGANISSSLDLDVFVTQVVNGVPGAPVNVTNTPGGEIAPLIAVNPQGTVYLSWVGDNGTSVNFASIPSCAAVQQ